MECLKILRPVIPHAVKVLQSDEHVDAFHKNMIQSVDINLVESTDTKSSEECQSKVVYKLKLDNFQTIISYHFVLVGEHRSCCFKK